MNHGAKALPEGRTYGERTPGGAYRSRRIAAQEWKKKNYDRLTVQLPKGYREKLEREAASAGLSLNGFLKAMIEQKLEDKL